MSVLTAQWMWGDASLMGHGAARLNPFRWSASKSFNETIADLQRCRADHRKRPVDVRVHRRFPTGDAELCMSQHLPGVDDAVSRLKELASSPAPSGSSAGNPSLWATGRAAVTIPEVASFTSSCASASGSDPPGEIGEAAELTEKKLERQYSGEQRCNLAGMLEKKSRWRKEWGFRFFVMRRDRIDYYMAPPTYIDDERVDGRKGFIPLSKAVAAQDDVGRPHCISIGAELISCNSLAEQQRWMETINAAASAFARSRLRAESADTVQMSALSASKLLVIPPAEGLLALGWQEPSTVSLADRRSIVTILFVDGKDTSAASSFGSINAEQCGAQAICQLSLFDASKSHTSAPVQWLTEEAQERAGSTNPQLCVHVHANELQVVTSQSNLSAITCICALAMALLVGGSTRIAACAILMACLLLLLESQRGPAEPQRRRVTFSIERIENAAHPVALVETPQWVGRWKLDKSCSELYAPILMDLGVNIAVRKIADAANSVLTITLDPTHVRIHLKIWVSVEDFIPLDGSFTTKPVPPGSKMKGECRVCLTKCTATEMEMYTEFPDGNGDLRDTLTMNEDGDSFTRVVVRGSLSVTRVFRRDF